MRHYKQWEINVFQAWKIRRAVLFGVGWWQYQENPDLYTRLVLRAALSKTALHSVRDDYTRQKLESIGFTNVINTGCPTMWPFAEFDFSKIPTTKADAALVMLSDYTKAPELDVRLLETVAGTHKKVYFWPQGRGDLDYVRSLSIPVIALEHSMLEIRNLNAGIPGRQILKNLNLSIKKGEIHAVMGPNGSGKSTLASVLSGKPGYEVLSGEVLFNGINLLELKPEERAQQGVFLAFQYPVEIPGVNSTYFLKAALNECRKARGLPELDAVEFLALMKKKLGILDLDMISSVEFFKSSWKEIPHKFEAGTPDISGAIGMGVAVDYIDRIGMNRIAEHDHEGSHSNHWRWGPFCRVPSDRLGSCFRHWYSFDFASEPLQRSSCTVPASEPLFQ